MNINLRYKPFEKFNTTCSETFDNCVYATFNSNSFEESIKTVLSYGGDTDTNACIVGSMAEALYGVDIEDSMLASIGKTISWVFYPVLGQNNWGATVSAIQGLVAKEQVVSSMAVISGLAEDVEEGTQIFAEGTPFAGITMASAYAFMVFNLFSAPCFGAIGAMQRELGSTKRMLKAVLFQTVCAWLLATVVYQVGSRIENGTLNIANILVIATILIVILCICISKFRKKKDGCANCPYCNSCK